MDYNTLMRILNFTLIICLLVACSDQSDQIENSIKLKDVDAGEDLQLLRKDFQRKHFYKKFSHKKSNVKNLT